MDGEDHRTAVWSHGNDSEADDNTVIIQCWWKAKLVGCEIGKYILILFKLIIQLQNKKLIQLKLWAVIKIINKAFQTLQFIKFSAVIHLPPPHPAYPIILKYNPCRTYVVIFINFQFYFLFILISCIEDVLTYTAHYFWISSINTQPTTFIK